MPLSSTPPAGIRRQVWVCLGLALITIAVFGPTVRYSFLNYDDEPYVSANPRVLNGLTWHNVSWAFRNAAASNWHPLTWLSHMLDCQLYGLRPGWHHLTNLLFHLANTLLLFRLLERMTGALWRSALVAALFAVHPLHVESVAWVAERKDVLSTCFGLLCLLAYVCYAGQSKVQCLKSKVGGGAATQTAKRNPEHGSPFYFLSLLLFAGSLMSKPMLVTLPFLLLLLDYWPLCRFSPTAPVPEIQGSRLKVRGSKLPLLPAPRNGSNTPLLRLLVEKLPFLALSAASSLVTIHAQERGGALVSFESFPFSLRLANAVVSYARYLGKTLWPDQLAVFYPHPVHWPAWQVAGAGLLLASVSIAAIALARRRPYLFTGWFWYVGTLVPVIGLVQVGSQAMADRYMYLPAIGLFVALAWGVSALVPVWPRRPAVLGVASGLLLTGCVWCSAVQVRCWKDSQALFTHAIRVTRNNGVAYNNLGKALAQQERLEEAIQAFSRALGIQPNFASAHANIGGALRRQGKLDAAAAHFEAALFFHPEDAQVQNDLGNVLDNLGRPDAAVPHYLAALRLKPDLAEAEYNLAGSLTSLGKLEEAVAHYRTALRVAPRNVSAHYNLGYTLAKLGRLNEAKAEYLAAVGLNPNHLGARNNLGNLLVRLGQPEAAIPHFMAVLETNPDAAEAHYSLGKVLVGQEKPEQALPHLRAAVRLKPNLLPALNDLAWLLATNPRPEVRDGNQAVQLAERLCDLTGHHQAGTLATLAAAYAEAGRYAKAASTAQAAWELALTAQQAELAAALRQQLELYRSNHPFRPPPGAPAFLPASH